MRLSQGTPAGIQSLNKFATYDDVRRILDTRMKPQYDGLNVAVGRDTNTTINDVTWYTVVWESCYWNDGVESPASGSPWWTSGANITIPYDGVYHVRASSDWSADTVARTDQRIYHNSTVVSILYEAIWDQAAPMMDAVIYAAKGDTIQFRVYRSADDGLDSVLDLARLSIVRLAR